MLVQHGEMKGVALEQEIGSFGTAYSRGGIDSAYDRSFGGDPGHISRGELRFQAALRAAGGTAEDTEGDSRPTAGSKWRAYPEGDATGSKKTVVNVYSNKQLTSAPARAPPAHVGMTSDEANKDLNNYFGSIDRQVKLRERREATAMLRRLGGLSSSGGVGNDDDAAATAPAGPSSGSSHASRGRRVSSRGRAGHVRRRQSSLYGLLKKAVQSEEFQRDLVNDAEAKYKTSLMGDY